MHRALIFAHYDPHGIVDPHVLYALVCYRQFFEVIHFVSTAELDSTQRGRVAMLVEKVIVRNNVGYDFLSWRVGFEALPQLQTFEEVVFANDSCYGPCSDMSVFFDRVEALRVDLWGASINCQFRPHVQSFFMGFGRRLIHSGFITRFWSSVECVSEKYQLILSTEVGLSRQVEDSGFQIGGVVDFRNCGNDTVTRVIKDNISATDPYRSEMAIMNILDEQFPNPVQLYWGESLRQGMPFLKVELLRDNLLNANIANIYTKLTQDKWYDLSLISRHLERTTRCGPFPPAIDRTNAGLRDTELILKTERR